MDKAARIDVSYDGLRGDVVFCTWTGSTPMSDKRSDCFLSIIRETCCPVILVTPNNLSDWIKPNAPLHPAFPFLSEVHKADYLRCYLMHHFGGGYTDIKRTLASWKPFFAALREAPDAFGLGYTEIGPHGIAPASEHIAPVLQRNFSRIIGNCAYIFRKQTNFTEKWLALTHAKLDDVFGTLKLHPAVHPMDQIGVTLPSGEKSLYPLRWQELLGELFHPLVFANSERFVHANIAPVFRDYR